MLFTYLEALIPFIFFAPDNIQLQIVALVVSQLGTCGESLGSEIGLSKGTVSVRRKHTTICID